METLTFTTTIRGSLGTINAPAKTVEGDACESISNTVPAGETLTETIAVDKDLCVALYLWSDKAVTVSIGADDFTLVANTPYWWEGDAGDAPLAADVTTVVVDNEAGTDPAAFKAEFLLTVGVHA